MKAVIFEQPGRAEDVLIMCDVPSPTPSSGQVLIKVAARPIHPADFLFIAGRYRLKPTFPQVAGFDGVGTITACGPGVTDLKPGMRVAFRSPGSWAEFAVAPISRVYPVPPGIPDAVACQFPLNPLTAWGLLAVCKLPEGARVLATAGRSVIARILTALALRRKLKLTLLVREDTSYIAVETESGKTVASGANVSAALHDVVISTGRFRAILDAVGGEATLALIDALEEGGRLVSYGILDDSPITIHASTLLFKNITWSGFSIDGWMANAPQHLLATAQLELWTLLSEESDLLPIIASFGLDNIQEAVRLVRGTTQAGKVLLI